jgi:hypothetical protein
MPNRMIGTKPLSNAEKQKRYRAKQKAEIDVLRATPILPFAEPVNKKTIREEIKQELIKSWEPEMKAAKIAEQRKKVRELIKRTDDTFKNARTIGICDCAAYFIGKDRVDIAQHLLHHFMITKDDAKDALEDDKRTKSMTFEMLDKAGAWGIPPRIIE